MQKFEIGVGVDLDFGATQPSDVLDMTPEGGNPLPFQDGGSAVAVLSVVGWAQAEQNAVEMELQGSPNGLSGWETVLDDNGDPVQAGLAAGSPLAMFNIVIPPYLRLRNLSATAGDGYGSAYLLQN